MSRQRFWRTGVIAAVLAGLVAMGQPAFALSTGPDRTWGVKGKVYAMAQQGDTLFVGGTFTKAIAPDGETAPVSNLAAFSASAGTYIPGFSVKVTNSSGTPRVNALAVSSDGTTLYIGGSFNTVNGLTRHNFAAVDLATGGQVDPAVNPAPNKPVWAILATPGLVYFGGVFTKVGASPRAHLAAISASDGGLSSTWAPSTAAGTDPCPSLLPAQTVCGPTSNGGTGTVHSLALSPDGSGLFVGGNFYYVDGTPRNALAEVSATDGSLLPWRVPWRTIPSEGYGDPYTGPNVVWAIVPTSTNVYIGYGRTPNGIESYTAAMTSSAGECASGCATSLWTDGTIGNVESLALSPDGTRLFAGGHFGTAVMDNSLYACGSNVYAHGLLSVNPTNGAYYCDWLPEIVPFGGQYAPGSGQNKPNYVGGWVMHMTPTALFVGGYFTSISGVPQSGFARFTLSGTPPPPPSAPVIASFSPTSGPPGTVVTLTGSGFTGTTAVRFGKAAAASFTVDSDTQITATVPVGALSAPITVTAAGGSGSSGTNFRVTVVVSSFSPTSGPVGTTVVITGIGFSVATGVEWGTVHATSFTIDSDTQITATVPAGAVTSPIKVQTAKNGLGKSPTRFTVTP